MPSLTVGLLTHWECRQKDATNPPESAYNSPLALRPSVTVFEYNSSCSLRKSSAGAVPARQIRAAQLFAANAARRCRPECVFAVRAGTGLAKGRLSTLKLCGCPMVRRRTRNLALSTQPAWAGQWRAKTPAVTPGGSVV